MLFAIVFILWLCLGSYVDKMICIPTLIVACHQFASLPLTNQIINPLIWMLFGSSDLIIYIASGTVYFLCGAILGWLYGKIKPHKILYS